MLVTRYFWQILYLLIFISVLKCIYIYIYKHVSNFFFVLSTLFLLFKESKGGSVIFCTFSFLLFVRLARLLYVLFMMLAHFILTRFPEMCLNEVSNLNCLSKDMIISKNILFSGKLIKINKWSELMFKWEKICQWNQKKLTFFSLWITFLWLHWQIFLFLF